MAEEEPKMAEEESKMAEEPTPAAEPTTWADESAPMDGAVAEQGGSSEMREPEYDVEVKLIDENSPLYSVKSFDELGLYALHPCLWSRLLNAQKHS